ncbi:LPXTG cell wall anchor domain-containing protein [Facklamia sp. P12950]|uniref:LPXTG cell wall anchor domain-containing protein n=1 Tax=unclassified Facklamia TaxID=2622293 RepID=UPI003D180BB1
MKRIIVVLMLFTQSFSLPNVHAQKGEMTYLKSQTDKNMVSLEACQILLRETPLTSSNSQEIISDKELQNQFEANQVRMTAINERYQILNQEIISIQEGPSNSLNEANLALEEVIETLYQNLSIEQQDFVSLSAQEQLALISQDETVIEWQAYIEELNQILDQYISEQAELEAEYQQLLYDNETLGDQIQSSKETMAQLSQCQLYPYSTTAYLINQENMQLDASDLATLIVSIDNYLQKIVPKAYAKVTFQQIYDLFNKKMTVEELNNKLTDKEVIVLDDFTFTSYQYAKELSLFDIEVMAYQALNNYYINNKAEVYHAVYSNLLNLKESQLHYFYLINSELFENLKHYLANYLNQHQLISDENIQQIKTLHDRYQMKLVLYNENNQTWSANLGADSGYLLEYQAKDLLQTQTPNNESTDMAKEDVKHDQPVDQVKKNLNDRGLLKLEDKQIANETDKQDNLAFLKDKLANKTKGKKASNLAKPSDKDKNIKDKTQSNDKKSQLLPTTGEQKFYLNIAWSLLIIGLIALLINRYFKQLQHKKRIQDHLFNEEDLF